MLRELRPVRMDGPARKWRFTEASWVLVLSTSYNILLFAGSMECGFIFPSGSDRWFKSHCPGQIPMPVFCAGPWSRVSSLCKEHGPIQDNILNHEADTSLWPNLVWSFPPLSFLIGELKTYGAHNHYKIFSLCHSSRLPLKSFLRIPLGESSVL